MQPKNATKEGILERLEALGEPTPENLRKLARQTGIPEAEIYGVASFYHLIDHVERRVCTSLSCRIQGAQAELDSLRAQGINAVEVSCLGQCDRPVAMLDEDHAPVDLSRSCPVTPDNPELPMNLGGEDTADRKALSKLRQIGAEAFLDELEHSGLQGRGGAGFSAAFKWRSVREQAQTERYVVCNADEAEPGTFKDRELMLRRPHLVLEGLAIAAEVIGAKDIYIYVRGAFGGCRESLEAALEAAPFDGGLSFHLVSGHGAYICGEETALLESLEGERGMPRLKPPYPTVQGFRGKPTLIHNVETLACIRAIILRGGQWFKELGRTQAGTKLYCISGHIAEPGVYELPLGVTLNELVACAGGYIGTPLAFSPGGASSGFLPMRYADTPMDFQSLAEVGSMLGSAGVVVLNDTVNMADVVRSQTDFFEAESCGQCAPCRIGTRLLNRALQRHQESGDASGLAQVADIAWEMEEGSICGLGIAAPLPLTSAMKHFPESFGSASTAKVDA
jgi:NADH:ubiquinone oxidoreductase subunit F (NADH-binding)